ncbi:ATP-binding protein [Sphingobacterium spiritivorum]|uniref:ATP-binding protein n=1 Tax=Sphingobacterium spiritivorum TaxID=258 RepID=UPI001919280A|nr:ATP-binding protein [Sphingobacterium spiritivorum]QQT24503.1 ATP-binding protein [Sphingobacterium spiritivorum]
MKNIIGRDLITDDFIAIFELVKNSYDAHAKHVIINFEDNRITIADNGKGMSESDLRTKWFAVAYSAKQDGSEDDDIKKESHLDNLKSKRFYAGAKGVGRFSCDRLGNNLTLTTSKYNDNLAHQITVSWKDFEKNAKESFQNIKVPYLKIPFENVAFPKKSKNGTILDVSVLNSRWDEEKIRRLKHSLEKLINPFSSDDEFNIEIRCERYLESDRGKPERQKINGSIKNSILDVLNIKTTQIDLEVDLNKVVTKLYDRGTLIYHIEEPNIYSEIIDDVKINLYYLNRSAKVQFGKIMDIEPVNYGNVFLFKNGFRVQPYGNVDDDSWGLDKRKQQGYNRFLGTRDLFGRVDITTENFEQFKEVSSRDGGLVNTQGTHLLKELFIEKSMKRLERYVVGVLWGEAFLRKGYFRSNDDTLAFRNRLEQDKDADDYNVAASNLGSKLDFVNLIKSLSDDNNIHIVSYDKNLVSFVNEQLDIVQPKFIKELELIAEKTNDESLLQQVKLTEENFKRIEREKEEALKREEEERKRRIEAEQKAREEELKRIEAERRQKEEEEKRRVAELETERKERQRLQAELDKLNAEKRAKEEAEKNKELSDKLDIETKKNQYLNSTRKTLSDDAEQLVHSIDLYVGNASTYVNELLATADIDNKIKSKIYAIKNSIDKALKVSQIIIKSNFDYKHTSQRVNLPTYIKEYLEDIGLSRKSLSIKTTNVFEKFYLLNPIDIDIIFDNLISNSIKAKAKNIEVSFEKTDKNLIINYYDDGNGVPENLVKNPSSIFELGVRESTERGSGIGMYDVFNRVKQLKGSIEFSGNGQKLKGASFKIVI